MYRKRMIITKQAFWRKFPFILTCLLMIGAALGEASARRLPTMYDDIIDVAADKYDLPIELIHSIIRAESNYDSRAVSPKGAKGLMQLMPTTAKIYGVQNVFDPKENIEGGVKYLKDLVKLYKRNTRLVLAAYNAGQEAVKKYSGIPPYSETRDYIEKVMSTYTKPTILTRTIIYSYYDENGRLVLTNSAYLYSLNRHNKE